MCLVAENGFITDFLYDWQMVEGVTVAEGGIVAEEEDMVVVLQGEEEDMLVIAEGMAETMAGVAVAVAGTVAVEAEAEARPWDVTATGLVRFPVSHPPVLLVCLACRFSCLYPRVLTRSRRL